MHKSDKLSSLFEHPRQSIQSIHDDLNEMKMFGRVGGKIDSTFNSRAAATKAKARAKLSRGVKSTPIYKMANSFRKSE